MLQKNLKWNNAHIHNTETEPQNYLLAEQLMLIFILSKFHDSNFPYENKKHGLART